LDRNERITVALPTCNGARHLREALASIKAQTDVAFDLIVSDDRSDDETLTIVRDLCGDRVKVSVNSERLGLARNWNRCVELSQTDWVAIFHQDDVMLPGHLASHLQVIDQNPTRRIGIIASSVLMIDEAGKAISPRVVDPGGLKLQIRGLPEADANNIVLPDSFGRIFFAQENPLRCSAVTLCKQAHRSVGGFDPSYRYVVDWQLWIKIARGWDLAWCFGPATVSMRWHPASETQRFQTGTADLEETTKILDYIDWLDGRTSPQIRLLRPAADARLARAYLNRAHVTLKNRDAELARHCLDRSIELSRSILKTIALDPRLAVQMVLLKARPDLAVRWFGRRTSGE
jgi:glycosyltransferase involved in cell wall biosynthesis